MKINRNSKKIFALIGILAACALAAGCTTIDLEEETESGETDAVETDTVETEAVSADSVSDDSLYVGEYNDADSDSPNLEIARGEDGKYSVQIAVYRLASFTDGVGELTSDGMTFTATDPNDGTISGIITVTDDGKATVTFTDSSWSLLESGSYFEYTKTSDTPNLWME
jgi:hypothetical protein